MHACELTAAITVLANALASNKSVDDITLLAVFFTQLGDTLATIATHKSICEKQ